MTPSTAALACRTLVSEAEWAEVVDRLGRPPLQEGIAKPDKGPMGCQSAGLPRGDNNSVSTADRLARATDEGASDPATPEAPPPPSSASCEDPSLRDFE